MPQGGDPDLNAQLRPTPLLEFGQRQIRLLRDPPAQRSLMRPQAGPPVAPYLLRPAMAYAPLLIPEAFHTAAAHPEALADLAGAGSIRPGGDDALT
jgi:hypothetical protein